MSGLIELAHAEEALLSKIDFNPSPRTHDYRDWREICASAASLTRALLQRKAVPAERLRYFSDPLCNVGGRGSSREDVLRRSARGGDMLADPDFLRHLHYFIYGPVLPQPVIDAFQRKIDDCRRPWTGSAAPKVAELARQLTRSYKLDRRKAPEEFFKLALDCGLDAEDARVVRDRVMQLR